MSIKQSINKYSQIPLDSLMLDIDAENVIGNVALDASPFGNNGIINGGVSVVDGIGGGKAFLFDGSTGYIDFGNILGFERTDAFSVSCWVNINATDKLHAIYSKMNHTSPYTGHSFYILTTNALKHYLNGNSLTSRLDCDGITTVNLNNWYHITITYDGSSNCNTLQFYLNSTIQSKGIVTNALDTSITNTINFLIGGRTGITTQYFSGFIQNFKLFNKELNPQEVRALYDECRAGEIILYSNEAVGNTGSPTVAQVTFTPISIPDLESFIDKGYLKIDIKCTNYVNFTGNDHSIEIGSLTNCDTEELGLVNLSLYGITDIYKTFYFPLKNFYMCPNFRPTYIQRIRIYFYVSSGTGQVSWKNASIIL